MVRIATIVAQDDTGGHVAGGLRPRGKQLEHTDLTARLLGNTIFEIVILYAGEAAQRKFCPRSVRPHHASGDRDQAMDYALRLCDGEQSEWLLRWCKREAVKVVNHPYCVGAIRRVAEALIVEKTLKRERLRELLFDPL